MTAGRRASAIQLTVFRNSLLLVTVPSAGALLDVLIDRSLTLLVPKLKPVSAEVRLVGEQARKATNGKEKFL